MIGMVLFILAAFAQFQANGTLAPVSTPFSLPTGDSVHYITTTGSDAANGLTNATAWATPNHALNCGDVIIAATSAYTNTTFQENWGTVSNCPSTTGGIDGTGGINFAILLCGGASVGDCTMSFTPSGVTYGFLMNSNNWAVEGFRVNSSYTTSDSGFAYVIDGTSATNVIHHIAFVNDIAYKNASATFIQDNGVTTTRGGDYWAIVGMIAQDSAGRCDGFYDAAIDIIGVGNLDAVAGTHVFAAQNFSYNNLQPVGCNGTDGESMMTDTLDAHGYSQQIVIKNNILAGAERYGMQFFYQVVTVNTPTIKFYNNTLYGNNVGPANSIGTCGFADGGINVQSNANNMPWTITIQNNIVQETLAACLGSGGNALYAQVQGTNPNGTMAHLTVGGTGNENVYLGLATTCSGNFCDGPGGSCSSSCATNQTYVTTFETADDYGVNTYKDPAFNNASDLVTNRYGVPNCSGFKNTVACLGWDAASKTLTNPSFIYDLVATATGTTGKGYQTPSVACANDPDYPTWLKGVVYLHWDGANITQRHDLITTPCGL